MYQSNQARLLMQGRSSHQSVMPESKVLKPLGTVGSVSTITILILNALSLLALFISDDFELLAIAGLFAFVAGGLFLSRILSVGVGSRLLAAGFTTFYLVGYPLSAILLVLVPEHSHPMLLQDRNTIMRSFMVGLIGWQFWMLGYTILSQYRVSSSRKNSFKNYQQNSGQLLIAVASIGVVCRLLVQLFTAFSGSSAISAYGVIPSTLAGIGAAAAAIVFWSDHRWSKGAFILISLYSISGLFGGMRSGCILPWLTFIAAGACLGKLSLIRTTVLFFTIIAAVVICYPLLTAFKLLMHDVRQTSAGWNRVARVSSVLEQLGDDDQASSHSGSIYESLHRVATRYSHLQYGGNIVTTGLRYRGWLNGESLYQCVVTFIPRSVWPNKPVIGLGKEAYHWMGYTGKGMATVPLSTDWYLNYGFLGVIVGMSLSGCYYSFIEKLLLSTDLTLRAVGVSLVYPLAVAGMGITGVFTGTVIPLCAMFGICTVVNAFWSVGRRQRRDRLPQDLKMLHCRKAAREQLHAA